MKLLSGLAALVATLVVGGAAALAVPVPVAPAMAGIVTISDRSPPPERQFAPKRQKLGGPTQKLGRGHKPRGGTNGGHSHGGHGGHGGSHGGSRSRH